MDGPQADWCIDPIAVGVEPYATRHTFHVCGRDRVAQLPTSRGACPQPRGDVCTVGDLPTSQSDEIVAGARVRDAASAGEKITLTATAKASGATSFHASATIGVAASKSSSSSDSDSDSGSVPPLPTVPGSTLPALPSGAFTSPTDPSGLFPTVSPSTSPSATSGQAKKDPKQSDATTVSASLPLDSRLIGGQLAGLVLLASAFISTFIGKLPEAQTTSAGSLGGAAACAPSLNGRLAECVWADDDTFGVVASQTLGAPGLADEMRQVRPMVEHQVSSPQ